MWPSRKTTQMLQRVDLGFFFSIKWIPLLYCKISASFIAFTVVKLWRIRSVWYLPNLVKGLWTADGGQLHNLQKPDHFKLWRVMNIFLGLFQWWKSFLERMKFEFTGVSCFTNIVKFSWLFIQKLKIGQSCILRRYILWKTLGITYFRKGHLKPGGGGGTFIVKW